MPCAQLQSALALQDAVMCIVSSTRLSRGCISPTPRGLYTTTLASSPPGGGRPFCGVNSRRRRDFDGRRPRIVHRSGVVHRSSFGTGGAGSRPGTVGPWTPPTGTGGPRGILAVLAEPAMRDEVDRVAAAVGVRVVHAGSSFPISRKT